MGDTERTNIIVVGAGASNELGLPVGTELKKRIAELCRYKQKDPQFGGYANRRFGELVGLLSHLANTNGQRDHRYADKVRNAAISISNNMNLAPSIDNFMDTHSDNDVLVRVGKIAITEEILKAERESTLGFSYRDGSLLDQRWEKTSNTWLGSLFGLLVAQRDFGHFIEALKKITFISFNYDRCIEEFFLKASQEYFRSHSHPMNQSDISAIEEALNVIHPYGSVGELEFSPNFRSGFGVDPTYQTLPNLIEVSAKIKTFTEGTTSEELIPRIHATLETCEVLIFLGFAFHPLNMKIITRPDKPFGVKRVLATGMDQSEESQDYLRKALASHYCENGVNGVSILNGTCTELFDFHHRFLSGEDGASLARPAFDWGAV